MIIVSQDRKTIVNFEQVTRVYTEYSFDGKPHIYADMCYGECEVLATYPTEARAKEVLAGIVAEYESFIMRGSILDEHGRTAQGELIPPKVYRMPEV